MLTASRDLSTQIRTRNFPVGAVFADNIVRLIVGVVQQKNELLLHSGRDRSWILWNFLKFVVDSELRRECELNGLWRVETEKNPVIYI